MTAISILTFFLLCAALHEESCDPVVERAYRYIYIQHSSLSDLLDAFGYQSDAS